MLASGAPQAEDNLPFPRPSPGEGRWSLQAGEGDALRMKFHCRHDWTFRS